MKFVHLISATCLAIASLAANASTKEEAEGLQKAAAAAIKAKGVDVASKEFSEGGSWQKENGALYVFIADFKGTVLAHSANAKIVGKNLWEAKDATGALIIQQQVEGAKKGTKSMDIRWMNPATKQIGDAEVLMSRLGTQDLYLGVVRFK
jgi:signal transduction histidine kinase